MYRRIAIKTAVICTGAFIMLISLALLYISHNYKLDTEERVQVAVTNTDIEAGTVLNESNIVLKTVRLSDVNKYMVLDLREAIGKKALAEIRRGDYINSYYLLDRDKWYDDDHREIVLPMDFETRLANLIKKGSLVDIILTPPTSNNSGKSVFKSRVVLSKITVEDIIDDNGLNSGENIGSRKAYAKFILSREQRDKVYIAQQMGKLKYELYCDSTQKPAQEEFSIPQEYLAGIPAAD